MAHGKPGPKDEEAVAAPALQLRVGCALAALGHAQGDAWSMLRSWVRGVRSGDGADQRGIATRGPAAMRRAPLGRGVGGPTSGLLAPTCATATAGGTTCPSASTASRQTASQACSTSFARRAKRPLRVQASAWSPQGFNRLRHPCPCWPQRPGPRGKGEGTIFFLQIPAYVAGALPGAQHPPLEDALHDAPPPAPSILGP